MIEVIVVAAGSGSRLGYDVPKAFVPLAGKEMFCHSAKLFDACSRVDSIILVVPDQLMAKTNTLVKKYSLNKVKAIVAGGKERNDSVANGFAQLDARTDTVLIHDAARPLLSAAVLGRVLDASQDYKAVFPGLPAVDTIKEIDLSTMKVEQTLDRAKLYRVQTPQAFSADIIPVLLSRAQETTVAYDEAMLLEGICAISVVEGEEENFKITRKSDLSYAEYLLMAGNK